MKRDEKSPSLLLRGLVAMALVLIPLGWIAIVHAEEGGTAEGTAEEGGTVAAADTDLVGRWLGTLDAGGPTLRVILDIASGDDGLRAVLHSPDQGASDIPVESVEQADGQVTIAIPVIGAVFEGRLSDDGAAIDGEWKQAGMVLALVLQRSAQE